jgi:hypothetical protein
MYRTRFVVASVPHTGTFTTEAFLDLIGVEHVRKHMEPNNHGIEKKQWQCIIPMRDPRDTWQSIYQRHYNKDYISQPGPLNPCDQLLGKWNALRKLREDNSTIIFAVDKIVKEGYWNELAKFLNVHPNKGSDSLITTHLQGKKHNHSTWEHPLADTPEWIEDECKYWGYT